jgi:16S rRNA (guanine966-N2)-methyltransferase
MIISIRMEEGHPGLHGARVLDLYAGSGSFGLECLSRGAGEVVFVERDRAAINAIRTNLENLGLGDRARIETRDVGVTVSSVGSDFDLAFCDPPYDQDPWPGLLRRIPAGLLVAHTEVPLQLTDDWVELRRRSYGRPHVVLARRRQ